MQLITSRFGFQSTAEEVSQGFDLKGKNVLITGAGSGIGLETARILALRGADVTLAVRNVKAAESLADGLKQETGNAHIRVAPIELSDFDSIANLVNSWQKPLHLLINNAGVMAAPETRTAQGIELQFATNHLGHFALACGLKKFMMEAGGARIICVSSTGHLFSPVVFDDINFLFRPYDPLLAYAQSKAAVNLFAVGASDKWGQLGIHANALNPGAIATNLQRHVGNALRSPPELHKTIAQGAATSVFLATSPLVDGIGGKYFNDCNEARPVERAPRDPAEMARSVAPYSLAKENALRLWERSIDMIASQMPPSKILGWFE